MVAREDIFIISVGDGLFFCIFEVWMVWWMSLCLGSTWECQWLDCEEFGIWLCTIVSGAVRGKPIEAYGESLLALFFDIFTNYKIGRSKLFVSGIALSDHFAWEFLKAGATILLSPLCIGRYDMSRLLVIINLEPSLLLILASLLYSHSITFLYIQWMAWLLSG